MTHQTTPLPSTAVAMPKYGDADWCFPPGLYRNIALHSGIKENYLLRRMSKETRKWFKKTPELKPWPFFGAVQLWYKYARNNYSVKWKFRITYIPFTMHFSESSTDPATSLRAVSTCLELTSKDWTGGLTMYLVKMIPPSFGKMVTKVFELKSDGYGLLDLDMAVLADSVAMTRHFLPMTLDARLVQAHLLSLCAQSTKLIHVFAEIESKKVQFHLFDSRFREVGQFATSKVVREFLKFSWFRPGNEFFYEAGKNGNLDVLQLCVASADPRLDPSLFGNLAIDTAARYGNIDCVEILLTDPRGSRSEPFGDIIYSSISGIRYCTVSASQAIIKLLLRKGLGLEVYDSSSHTNKVFLKIVKEGYKDQLDRVYSDPEIRALLPPNAHTYHLL